MKIVISQLVCEHLRKYMENEKYRYSRACHVFLACSSHISASTTVVTRAHSVSFSSLSFLFCHWRFDECRVRICR